MKIKKVPSKGFSKFFLRPDFRPIHQYAVDVDILDREIGAIFKDGKMVERIVRDENRDTH